MQAKYINPIDKRPFWRSVEKTDTCWYWRGHLDRAGYGKCSGQYLDSVSGKIVKTSTLAHRHSYIISKGPVTDGLSLDHLCRVRHCVNPDHLEAVTQKENCLRSEICLTTINVRKPLCKNGHEFDLVVTSGGRPPSRGCSICIKAGKIRDYQKNKVRQIERQRQRRIAS